MFVVQASCKSRISGLKSEVKHLDQEIKKNTPELKKVGVCCRTCGGVLMFS